MEPAPFSYEYVTTVSQDQYVRRESALLGRRPMWVNVVIALLMLMGIACLVRASTIPLALLLLAVGIAAWTSPLWTRIAYRGMYQKASYLHGPITYGVNERGPSFKGGELSAKSHWDNVKVWGELDEQMWIAASGMPTVFLPIEELRARGLYERVLGLAKGSGVEFDSAKGEARRVTTTAKGSAPIQERRGE